MTPSSRGVTPSGEGSRKDAGELPPLSPSPLPLSVGRGEAARGAAARGAAATAAATAATAVVARVAAMAVAVARGWAAGAAVAEAPACLARCRRFYRLREMISVEQIVAAPSNPFADTLPALNSSHPTRRSLVLRSVSCDGPN